MTHLFVISGLLIIGGAAAFVTTQSKPSFVQNTATSSLFALYKDVDDVGFITRVSKPLGVIFSENPEPYYGVVVEDVEAGLNGGMAGLRVGDNLVAINGQSVVGDDFDTVMGMLVAAEGELDLQLYRGSVRSLFVILSNKSGGLDPEQEEAADSEEPVVMDENYESPVRVEVEEEKPLTAGDVFNAFKKVGSMLTDDAKKESAPQEEKKKGGLFGGLFSGETIQLEGDDAKGLKGQERE